MWPLLLLALAQAPGADPAYPHLDRAYQALRAGDLEAAVAEFRNAARIAPDRVSVHKELGYTYMKMGETAKAVESFEAVLRLTPNDYDNALSLGFLYFETRREHRALEMFERAARSPKPETQRTATETLARLTAEFQWQINRWERAVRQDPKNPSARLELGALYRKSRNYRAAIEHYEALRKLQPRDYASRLEIARLYDLMDEPVAARGWYVLAWRSPDARISEWGRAGLGNDYPAAADFERALAIEPRNLTVRRDLAYLYLNQEKAEAAAAEFEKIVAQDQEDWQSVTQLAFIYADAGRGDRARPLLERVMKRAHPDLARKAAEVLLRLGDGATSQRERLQHMRGGYAALAANNLTAAAELFEGAHRADPADDTVALQLGWIYNMLQRDEVAVEWFRRASTSADPYVATTARRAARNLEAGLRKVVYTFWTNPVISSRWQDLFGYAQWKAELRLKKAAIRPYLSLRFNGDVRTRSESPAPLFYSDGGWTLGVGIFAQLRKDLHVWGEAGNTLSYYANPVPGTGRFYPDYRGGATWFRSWGPSLYTDLPGYRKFADAAVASIFISRYSNDLFTYVQTRSGYHLPRVGLMNSQAYLAVNYVRDTKDLYWANLAEVGPAFAFGFRNFPQMQTSIGLYRGAYTDNRVNPRPPNFWDLRVNIWYARSF